MLLPEDTSSCSRNNGAAQITLIPLNFWAARYNTWLLSKLTSKAVVLFLFLLLQVAHIHLPFADCGPGDISPAGM